MGGAAPHPQKRHTRQTTHGWHPSLSSALLSVRGGRYAYGLFEPEQQITGLDLVAVPQGNRRYLTGTRGHHNGLHFHGGEDDERVALLDVVGLADFVAEDVARHGGADLLQVARLGLDIGLDLRLGCLVLDGDRPGEPHDLEVHFTRPVAQHMCLGDVLEVHLTAGHVYRDVLTRVASHEVVWRGQHGDVAEFLAELLVLVEHLGVHDRAHKVGLRELPPMLLLKPRPQVAPVDGRQVRARPALDGLGPLEHLGPQRLGEAEGRLPDIALEELDDGLREGEAVSLFEDVVWRDAVLDHELGHVADDLGRRGHLDQITHQHVGVGVCLLDVVPLVSHPQRPRLHV
mmetsp:Transcript_35042/g.87018  ORF Transcript_35042/g.87018 Transcript_35042/m.87018 type:complete len:344 (-) Transcript_35042:2786-3817(-)